MADRVNIGIIGVGTIGSVHADAYAKVPGAKVVALCDILPDRLGEKGRRHGVGTLYETHHELLTDPNVEAVSICVPNNCHAPIAIDAFAAGKHVLLEKPMAMSAREGEAICAARDEAGKVLQMGMVMRQAPEAGIIKEAVELGRLGEIYQVRVNLIRRRGIPGLGGWFTTKAESGGGCLIDIAVHFFDLAMYTSDLWNPTRVSAKTYAKFGSPMEDYHFVSMWAGPPKFDGTFDVDDYVAGLVRFGESATMSFEVAWACNAAPGQRLEILGDKGGVLFENGKLLFRTEVDDRIADINIDYDRKKDNFAGEMDAFVKAVRGQGEPAATGEEGVVCMRLIDAIYASSDANREVETGV